MPPKKKREENFFKRNYTQSWDYLKESKGYFLLVIALIIAGVALGYLFPAFFQDFIRKFLEELVAKTKGLSAGEMILFILKNNVQSSIIALIFGIAFGIFPIVSALFNGYLIGFVVRKTSEQLGIGIIWNLVPHGIFEFPAIILSMGLGIKLARFIFARKRAETFWHDLENSLRVFLFIVIPLLIIAAIIEGILIRI